eukprot:2871142-Pleurochrysis_carterae.AAC.2
MNMELVEDAFNKMQWRWIEGGLLPLLEHGDGKCGLHQQQLNLKLYHEPLPGGLQPSEMSCARS